MNMDMLGVQEVSPGYEFVAENPAVPVGYKQTEVGVIPEDWEVKHLKEISPSQSVGLVINPSTYFNSNGTVPMLVGSNVYEGKIDWLSAKKITQSSNEKLPASKIYENDLVVVRVGDPGVAAVVPAEYSGSNCASMMIVRGDKSFDSRWLCFLMNSDFGRNQIKNVQYGTAQKQFNISDAVDFIYPVPGIKEQRAIATALSDVDALLEELDRLIAKKRNIKQAAMQQLLTGETRLPGFEGEWIRVKFSAMATLSSARIDPSRSEGSDFCIELEHISQGTGLLNGSTATTENSSLKAAFEPGDVLFGKLRAYLKKYWIASRSGVCSTEIWVLKANHQLVLPQYLFQIVTTDSFIESASTAHGTHMPRSDWKVVRETQWSIPCIDEQQAIAAVLSDIDTEIQALEQRRSKTAELKQGMMQELLTGRTRLV